MTIEEARAIALEQPGAVEGAHHGHPDFRVENKIFATLRPDQERSVLRLPLPFAESLEDGERRKIVSRSGAGWLSVHLPSLEPAEFRSLIEAARDFLPVKPGKSG